MRNNWKRWTILLAAVILAFTSVAFTPPNIVLADTLDRGGGPGGRNNTGNGGGTGPGTGNQLTALSAEEMDSLNRAILEEYGALNLYKGVIAQFGEVVPFAEIAQSEQQHVDALIRQADKYGVNVPANPGLTAPLSFTSLTGACEAGAAAEIADAALYDELRPDVTHSDILRVFDNLQNASLNNHLPAFQACE
ncbi:MAG: hypothetical protein GYA15_12510 [Leptolinea sp.]|jgi:hypothetical protein|nr:hypothetical protein [Leptolinea sp.]